MVLFCLKRWLDLHVIGRWKYDLKMKKIITGGKPPIISEYLDSIDEISVDETRLLGHNFERPTEALKKDFIKDYGKENQVTTLAKANLAIWIRYDENRKSAIAYKYVCLSNHKWYTLSKLFFWERITICLANPEEWLLFKV